MQSKSLLIAIAAFALTTSGVYASSAPSIMQRAGLNKQQIQAFAEAHELKSAGDLTAARDRLLEAGITDDTLLSMRRAIKGSDSMDHKQHRKILHRGQHRYEELSEKQREALRVAKANNDRTTVRAILDEAGISYGYKRNR